MDRDSFLFYKSYLDAGQKIPVKQRLKFYEIIIEFGLTGVEPEDTGDPLIDMALNFIRPLIKANIQNYLNGCKGGAPIGNKNAKKITEKQPKNNRQTTTKQGNVNDNDNVKENVKENDNDNVNENVNVKDIKEPPSAKSKTEKELDYLYDLMDKLPLNSEERKAASRRIGELENDEQ